MTYSATFKVAEISHPDPATTEVRATAETADITANTEGKVRSMELRVVLDEAETVLKEGDVITASGHFTGVAQSAD
ncbi:hypothetical protein [Actinomadura litoris]|uniref:Uncharacterized protein n=1 Tax=Actinomadura litoris TaxID=2678616 RepID=A0A7K1LAD0_9ACTN|nr:hypothetical protein [Actinomadura litoris]MUN41391.1 hypothetical protein [Actinomadura litoris]